jgi:prophage DNA circulation protein
LDSAVRKLPAQIAIVQQQSEVLQREVGAIGGSNEQMVANLALLQQELDDVKDAVAQISAQSQLLQSHTDKFNNFAIGLDEFVLNLGNARETLSGRNATLENLMMTVQSINERLVMVDKGLNDLITVVTKNNNP